MFTVRDSHRGAVPAVVGSAAPSGARARKMEFLGTRRQGLFPVQARAFPRKRRALLLLLFLTCLMNGVPLWAQAETVEEITVDTPTTSVDVGGALTVEWSYSGSGGTTGDLTSFAIDLYYCGDDGSSCGSSSSVTLCGDKFASLCTSDLGVCMDSDGSYDVTIPSDTTPGSYSVMVALSQDSSVASCSSAFAVTSSGGSSSDVAEGEPSLEVVYPDDLEKGSAFTAQWVYDDGTGEAEGTFEINLKLCDSESGDCDDGGCGTQAASLCEDPGCYDPGTGDYDVVIPADQGEGEYKLEVINSKDETSSCSESSFNVVSVLATPQPAPTSAAPVTVSPIATRSSSSYSEGTPGSPGTPPTPVPAKVMCDSDVELEIVYTVESDTSLPLLTVAHASGDSSEGGCLTLTKLYEWLGTDPAGVAGTLLYTVDPDTGVENPNYTDTPTGTWLLRTSIDVTNGVSFNIKGTAVDGDCDELKIYSTVDMWYRVMGYGGNIDIDSTLIRSWDTSTDEEHIFGTDADGKTPRSYISCVSEIDGGDETCDGVSQNDMGECRMDIVDSELGYLGYDQTESYGVSWKVRGLCEDLSNADTLFDSVRVYGDMSGSNIHHMWYGMYSYGHLGGVWTDNHMHNNHVYGFDPHDDSDYLTIEGNTVWNNGNHGIIASKRCDHLRISDNVVFNNDGSGIMLHKSCDDSVVQGNNCTGNFDAGVSLVETSRCNVSDNTFVDNRWGFRVILGSTDNVLEWNVLEANRYSDIYAYYGAEEEVPEVDPFTGINVNNKFRYNHVTYEVKTVVDIEDSEGTEISSNTFVGEDNGYFVFLSSTENHVVDNTGSAASGESDDITDSCFTEESDRLPLCA